MQRDDTATHRSDYTRSRLESNDVYRIPWPAESANLNPIESFLGILVRALYKNSRQFHTVEDLEERKGSGVLLLDDIYKIFGRVH